MSPSPASRPSRTPPVVRGCLEACRRCRDLVVVVTRHEPERARRAYAAIGPHLRHCLDHFQCLIRDLPAGEVDYDNRDRDERLERDPSFFLAELDRVVEALGALDPAAVGPISVRQEVASGGAARTVPTNLERELMFLSSHTIHHIAIMGVLAGHEGVEVSPDLGVAFSTMSHRERDAASRRR